MLGAVGPEGLAVSMTDAGPQGAHVDLFIFMAHMLDP